ncbi:MAG: RNA polymerase sigma factor [Sediminibacterium sp.]|nr:RNA polymerase sigma factor [Sediminibacterium sp.]
MKTQELTFTDLYETYKDQIFRLCCLYTHDETLALDLTQDCFIKVWQNLGTFRHESAIGTWIYRIAVNNCLLYRRKAKITTVQLGHEADRITEEEEHSREERVTVLHRAIQQLNDVDRAIISMVLENMSYRDIGTVMGMTENNIGVKVQRIKVQLKKRIEYGI